MKIRNKVIIKLLWYKYTDDTEFISGKVIADEIGETQEDELVITRDNVYDLFEGHMGSVDVLFISDNNEYPAVNICKDVHGSHVEMTGVYFADCDTRIPIIDVSSSGIFKWLCRAARHPAGYKMVFDLDMSRKYYNSVIGPRKMFIKSTQEGTRGDKNE